MKKLQLQQSERNSSRHTPVNEYANHEALAYGLVDSKILANSRSLILAPVSKASKRSVSQRSMNKTAGSVSRHSMLSLAQSIHSNENKPNMCLYGGHVCNRERFRRDLCREHFCVYARNLLRNTLASLYQAPYQAFGALDF